MHELLRTFRLRLYVVVVGKVSGVFQPSGACRPGPALSKVGVTPQADCSGGVAQS
jgi:hypothetical protein